MASTAVMNIMLGWLKGVANWILGLFDLAGSSGFSPLAWLSENWLGMLITLLIIGVVADLVVWLLRWRPHWVWFNKKRIVINDDNFFAGEDLVDSGLYDPSLFAEERPVHNRRPRPAEDSRPARRRPERPNPHNSPRRRRPAADADFFNVAGSDSYSGGEDDVFNVSDLPVSRDELEYRDSRKRR